MMSDTRPGGVALLGSGETSPVGGRAFEEIVRRLSRPPRVAVLESYAEALRLFRAVGAKLGEANVLLSLGAANRGAGKTSDARHQFEEAGQIYLRIGDRYSVGRALYRIGDCDADEKKWNDALAAYRKATELWQSIGLNDLAEQIIRPRIENAEKREE